MADDNKTKKQLIEELETSLNRVAELESAMARLKSETERLRLESVLRGSQRMEAIGKLAGGVAHDFNNNLSVISGFSEFVKDALHEGDPARDDIQLVLEAAERATKLTRQLLAFSRKQPARPVLLDLNSVVEDLIKMLGRVIGEDIDLRTVLGRKLGLVKADRGQIEQVLINLAINARDAMSMGGKLIIATENTEADEQFFADFDLDMPSGSYVCLSMSDTGVGMEDEVRQHIFEPFFTTKDDAECPGLGLSTVYGIAKQNSGCVWVSSKKGEGSTFKIYLPKATDRKTVKASQPTKVAAKDGQETILLVEDDSPVRNATRRMLEKAGYEVLEAESGENAIRLAQDFERPIHLLLTDVVMPKMSGKTLAQRLTNEFPDMPVLFMSGYTDSVIAHHGVLDENTYLLEKPFSYNALRKIVRATLEMGKPLPE